MKVAVFLETNWNLTVLFAYMHKKNIKHVTIISSQKIVMPLPNSIPIESYTIFDNKVKQSKFKSLLKYKIFLFKKRNLHFDQVIRFSTFSPLANMMVSSLNSSKSILLDDGFLLYNKFHPEEKYNLDGQLKSILYFLLSGKYPKFSFLDFSSVDEAYLIFRDSWGGPNNINKSIAIFPLIDIVNIESLKIVAIKYFDMENEVKEWIEIIESKDVNTLLLGSAFVSHGILSREGSEKILNKYFNNAGCLFKPHPAEMSLKLKIPKNIDTFHNSTPIELFLAFTPEIELIGFGTSTQFFMHDLLGHSSTFYLTPSIYSKDFISYLKSKCTNCHFEVLPN